MIARRRCSSSGCSRSCAANAGHAAGVPRHDRADRAGGHRPALIVGMLVNMLSSASVFGMLGGLLGVGDLQEERLPPPPPAPSTHDPGHRPDREALGRSRHRLQRSHVRHMIAMSEIDALLNEDRAFPPSDGVPRGRPTSPTRRSTTRAAADPEAFWAELRRASSSGSRRGTRCSTGSRRTRSGSSAAS